MFKLQHLWFRNVSIGRIAKFAFARLSNVGYVYFRHASIGLVEAGAFGQQKAALFVVGFCPDL